MRKLALIIASILVPAFAHARPDFVQIGDGSDYVSIDGNKIEVGTVSVTNLIASQTIIAGNATIGTMTVSNQFTLPSGEIMNSIPRAEGVNSGAFNLYPVEELDATLPVWEVVLTSPTGGAQVRESTAGTVNSGLLTVSSHVTVQYSPNVVRLPAGIWAFNTWCFVDSQVGVSQYIVDVATMSNGGDKYTKILSATSTEIDNTVPEEITVTAVQTNDVLVSTGDRILVRYWFRTTSNVSRTFTMLYQGTSQYSHINTPIPIVSILFSSDGVRDGGLTHINFVTSNRTRVHNTLSSTTLYLGNYDDTGLYQTLQTTGVQLSVLGTSVTTLQTRTDAIAVATGTAYEVMRTTGIQLSVLGSSVTTEQTRADSIAVATGTIYEVLRTTGVQLSVLGSSVTTNQTRTDAVAVATGTVYDVLRTTGVQLSVLGSSVTTNQTRIDAVAVATGTVYDVLRTTGVQLSVLGSSVTTNQTRIDAVAVATGTVYEVLRTTGVQLSVLGSSVSTLQTRVDAIAVATGTLSSEGSMSKIGDLTITTVGVDTNNLYVSINGIVISGDYHASISTQVSLALNNEGGLLGGAVQGEAASTWYSIWALSNGTTYTVCVSSLQGDHPLDLALPGTFTKYVRLGWVRNDHNSNIIPYYKRGKTVSLVTVTDCDTGTDLPALTDMSISSFVSPGAVSAGFDYYLVSDVAASPYVKIKVAGQTMADTTGGINIRTEGKTGLAEILAGHFEVRFLGEKRILYTGGGTNQFGFRITGYEEE